MKKIILSAPLFILLLTACSKKDSGNCTLNASSLEGTYKLTSVKAGGTEVFGSEYDDCSRDDTYTFKSGTVTVSDAGTKCSPPDDDTGAYSLSDNSLTVTEDSDATTYTVQNFTCSSMELTETFDGTDYIYHFEKQ